MDRPSGRPRLNWERPHHSDFARLEPFDAARALPKLYGEGMRMVGDASDGFVVVTALDVECTTYVVARVKEV